MITNSPLLTEVSACIAEIDGNTLEMMKGDLFEPPQQFLQGLIHISFTIIYLIYTITSFPVVWEALTTPSAPKGVLSTVPSTA